MVHKCPKTPKIGQISKTNVNLNSIYAIIIGSNRYDPAVDSPVFSPVFSVFCIFSSKFTMIHRKNWNKKIFFTLLPNDFSDFIMCSQIKNQQHLRKRGIDHDEEHFSTVQKNFIQYGVQRYLRRRISVHDRLRFFCSRIR